MSGLAAIDDRRQDVGHQTRHAQDLRHPGLFQLETPGDIGRILEFALIEQALPVECPPDGADHRQVERAFLHRQFR